jgi:hypothetical protein
MQMKTMLINRESAIGNREWARELPDDLLTVASLNLKQFK